MLTITYDNHVIYQIIVMMFVVCKSYVIYYDTEVILTIIIQHPFDYLLQQSYQIDHIDYHIAGIISHRSRWQSYNIHLTMILQQSYNNHVDYQIIAIMLTTIVQQSYHIYLTIIQKSYYISYYRNNVTFHIIEVKFAIRLH